MLNITCRTVGPLGTCCYILHQEGREDCVVIDPGWDAASIRNACGGKRIAAILLTHGHFDHISAVGDLMAEDTQLAVHFRDEGMLADPELNVSSLIRRRITCPAPTRLIREGDVLEYAGITLRVLHTPGHTPGSVCYEAGEHLFTGDTLFEYGYGRTDFPGGDYAALMASLRRLEPLQQNHQIYPGHGS